MGVSISALHIKINAHKKFVPVKHTIILLMLDKTVQEICIEIGLVQGWGQVHWYLYLRTLKYNFSVLVIKFYGCTCT